MMFQIFKPKKIIWKKETKIILEDVDRYQAAYIFFGPGVFMWEVYSEGRLPYECRSNAEVVESLNTGLRLLKPRLCPEPVYQLMQWCWKEVHIHISVIYYIDKIILLN